MRPLLGFTLVLALIALIAAPSAAQVTPRVASSFALIADPPTPEREKLARGQSEFFRFRVQPLSAVTLAEAIPEALASQFGVKREMPFDTTRRLYGWPERPGLYCDLLRSRGLYISAACLQDRDVDGDFDEGLRLDFNSQRADVLGVTDDDKIVGMKFTKVRVPLPAPIAYTPVAPAGDVSGRLALQWRRVPDKASRRDLAQLWISAVDYSTGTDGLSENVLMFDRAKLPADVEFYGIRLRIHGFNADDGRMRYTLLGMTDGAPIALLFRSAPIRIMIY